MKHPFLLTLLLSVFTLTSCNSDSDSPEPGTYPDSAAYVVTQITQNLEDETAEEYIFLTDKGDKLFLVDNQLAGDYEFADLSRIIIYFAIIEDYSKEGNEELEGAAYDCDYGVRLFSLNEVLSSETAIVTTEEESDAIADHAISYIYNSISVDENYINLAAGLRYDKLANIKLYLVENLSTDPEESEEGFLNLELRYDRGTDEAMGSTYDQYISLSLADFKERLEDMDGIILRAVTLSSGTINIKLEKSETKSRVSTTRGETL
ncbi:MAG: NigD-like C-terminal domain-containing protein [Rikenellaceae bacterium]